MLSLKEGVLLLALLSLVKASPANNHLEKRESAVLNGFTDSEFDSISDICKRGCPRILEPICAVDETDDKNIKYFHNPCLMEYDACRRGRAWKPTQMLQCITDVDPVIRDDCVHACPFIYDPVCASSTSNGAGVGVGAAAAAATDGGEEDYQIFGNRCIFGMENCLASGKWLEVREELCGLGQD